MANCLWLVCDGSVLHIFVKNEETLGRVWFSLWLDRCGGRHEKRISKEILTPSQERPGIDLPLGTV